MKSGIILFAFLLLVQAFVFDVDTCNQNLSDSTRVLTAACQCSEMQTEDEVSECVYQELCANKDMGHPMMFCFVAEINGGMNHETCTQQLTDICNTGSPFPGLCSTFVGFPGLCL